ncbi:MAG: SEL1-like repeat protein [Bacteroidales bacterium]|nr:SEL1-like repeat protein [Bacteroidales bacterium]MCF0189808.1 SEL1-like repeat protein [Marinilabiliaceae bacterium]
MERLIGIDRALRVLVLSVCICISTIAFSQQLTHQDTVAYKMGIKKRLGINTDQDYRKAGIIFKKLGEKGYAEAWKQMGDMLAQGLGCTKNENKSFRYYLRGNELGDVHCASSLANAYRKGIGVERNFKRAFEIADSIAEKGYGFAYYQIGEMYFKGFGVEQSYTKAVENFVKGSELQEKWSSYMLGICYAEGDGVSQNKDMAIKYFTEAMAQGHTWVEDVIERGSIDSVMVVVSNQIKDLQRRSVKDNTDASMFFDHSYWKGVMNIYEWSGEYIRSQRPIMVQILPEWGDCCHVTWKYQDGSINTFEICRRDGAWFLSDFSPNKLPETRGVFTGFTMEKTDEGTLRGELKRESLITGDPYQPTTFVLHEITENEFNDEPSNLSICRLYPNPIKDVLKVYFSLRTADKLSLKVYNPMGLEVKSINCGQYQEGENVIQVNLGDLTRGNYVLVLEGQHSKGSINVMKED